MSADPSCETEVIRVRSAAQDSREISRAADLIRNGQVVAFPTETVYGLGADALNPDAVDAIYRAKGRPAYNPIIVHVADIDAARRLVTDWPAAAQTLAERIWPGPLTLVLPKSPIVPLIVTAGGPTVAIRAPAHPVALALIRAAGTPLAAPSANRSGGVSPTRAEHVLRSLGGRIPMILDGGPTTGGLESTVLDLTTSPPRILRPGPVTASEIAVLIGPVHWAGPAPASFDREIAAGGGCGTSELTRTAGPGRTAEPMSTGATGSLLPMNECHPTGTGGQAASGTQPQLPQPRSIEAERAALEPLRSPGLLDRHYAPQAAVELCESADAAGSRVEGLLAQGATVGWMCFEPVRTAWSQHHDARRLHVAAMPRDARAYAAVLYETLHLLDDAGIDRIVVEQPPGGEEWAAVLDRLTRAARPQ